VKKLWTGRTARAELVAMAAVNLSLNTPSWDAHDAVESVIDGAKLDGSIKGAMYEYYMGTSDTSMGRLFKDVRKAARL
jgi:hypothetical protein